jgi:hypothetical protein
MVQCQILSPSAGAPESAALLAAYKAHSTWPGKWISLGRTVNVVLVATDFTERTHPNFQIPQWHLSSLGVVAQNFISCNQETR